MNPSNDSPPPLSSKKGPSGLAIAGIGCGALLVIACIAGGVLISKGCSRLKEVAGDFQKNPGKTAATLMVKANPDLELISTDDAKGEITIKNKKTGEVTTMSFDEMNQGKFKVTDSKGNETTIDGSASGQGRMTIKSAEGQTVIGGNASETAPPAWLPGYPGATPKEGGMRAEKNGIVSGVTTAESTDPIAKIKDFYEAKLKAAGFQVETQVINIAGADTAMINANKSDPKQTANAVINSENGKTNITLTYEGLK